MHWQTTWAVILLALYGTAARGDIYQWEKLAWIPTEAFQANGLWFIQASNREYSAVQNLALLYFTENDKISVHCSI